MNYCPANLDFCDGIKCPLLNKQWVAGHGVYCLTIGGTFDLLIWTRDFGGTACYGRSYESHQNHCIHSFTHPPTHTCSPDFRPDDPSKAINEADPVVMTMNVGETFGLFPSNPGFSISLGINPSATLNFTTCITHDHTNACHCTLSGFEVQKHCRCSGPINFLQPVRVRARACVCECTMTRDSRGAH